MGVIELFCNTSSLSLDRPKLGRNCRSLRRGGTGVTFMTSAVPVKEDGQQQYGSALTGDSFIRPHLRKLSPYQPILPFEVYIFFSSVS